MHSCAEAYNIFMVSSRLSRFEEKSARHRIAIGLIGSLGILILIAVFGLKLLIGFSVLIDRIRGGTTPIQSTQTSVLLPPVLDPLPEATNSASITVSGTAQSKDQVIVYLNAIEYKRMTVPDSGSFTFPNIPVDEGAMSVTAKLIDAKQNTSDLSTAVTTVIDRTPPKLTVDNPTDNLTVNDGTHKVTVSGITDPDMTVTINGRIAIVKSDGSFTYSLPISDGQNKVEVLSKDAAGNSTTVTRTVIYQP